MVWGATIQTFIGLLLCVMFPGRNAYCGLGRHHTNVYCSWWNGYFTGAIDEQGEK